MKNHPTDEEVLKMTRAGIRRGRDLIQAATEGTKDAAEMSAALHELRCLATEILGSFVYNHTAQGRSPKDVLSDLMDEIIESAASYVLADKDNILETVKKNDD